MEFEKTILSPAYNKKNGLSLGFILSVLFCSNIESTKKEIIYIFYIANIIPHDFLKHEKHKIDDKFLLELIFKLSANKKLISKSELRELVDMEDRGTFNKYFNEFLDDKNLLKVRKFTFYEVCQILTFWQGDNKWGRMEAYGKKELANRFTNGNYDNLEEKMTNTVFKYSYYRNHDLIKPADVKQFVSKNFDKKVLEKFYEDEFNSDYLNFFFYTYLSLSFKEKIKSKK